MTLDELQRAEEDALLDLMWVAAGETRIVAFQKAAEKYRTAVVALERAKRANYVLVDIGCYECGEDSYVIGVFETEDEAQAEKASYEERRPRILTRSGYIAVLPVNSEGIAVDLS